MKKYISKNNIKVSLILVSILLFLKLVVLFLIILSNAEILKGFSLNESLYTLHLITSTIVFLVFFIILFLYKSWKPYIIEIKDRGLNILHKADNFFVDFNDVESFKMGYSIILTNKNRFKIPISSLNNKVEFLIELKKKISNLISVKERKQIDNRIIYEKYMLISKKFVLPQNIYGVFFIIISICIVERPFSFFKEFSQFSQIFNTISGLVILGVIEIIRYLDFIDKCNKTDFKIEIKLISNYLLYASGILIWIFIIAITYFL